MKYDKEKSPMKNALRLSFLFILFGVLTVTTGCAKKRVSKSSALQAQVNQMTDEIVRLDQQVQELRASIEASGGSSSYATAGAATGASGIYRTPSGFELPSKDIQKALKNAGYYQGTVDGKIGPGTKEAVKAFQRDNGLEGDGVVGKRTWDKLRDYLGTAKA
jgi:murein L,D-transpeptidase YcbB/YkuD